MTSREEIFLALKYFFDVEEESNVHEIIGQDDDPLGTIAAALDEYRKVDSYEGWIKCSERMPEVDGGYLCWDGRYVSTYLFLFGSWQANRLLAQIITHWQPLPEPPTGEQ